MDTIFGKVLFVGPENELGGVGSVLEIYKKNIHHFNFIPTYPSDNKESKITFFIKSIFKNIRLLLLDRNIKILHLHSASKGSFIRKSIICIIGKLSGKKIVFHMHSGGFEYYYKNSGILKPYIKYILHSSDSIICLSKQWLEFYSKGMRLSNVSVIGNPVEAGNCEIKNSNIKTLRLLFLGKICDDKGIFGLIDYLKTNRYFLDYQIKLDIGGNGEDERLMKLLNDPVLNKHIESHGWVNGEVKKKMICDCDIFILPSYVEGLPVSILEAMASSKPVIATNVGGIPSIVINNYNGWLIDPGAFHQLDIVFEQIFSNENICSKYSANSFREARKYQPEVILAELATLYKSLIKE
jgi:glycosyltransferase involved in cell wall biosynthesis